MMMITIDLGLRSSGGNVREELDGLDKAIKSFEKKIKECEYKKSSSFVSSGFILLHFLNFCIFPTIFIFFLSLLCSMIFVNGRVRTGARVAHPQVVPDPSEHCALRGAPMGFLVLAVAARWKASRLRAAEQADDSSEPEAGQAHTHAHGTTKKHNYTR